ncbi:CGNR zinc finger domain-containing protein [Sphaerisporangium krabiense]|uniref:Putative RNA-binding Zn ribbon-like protein n=1 Tax=Sphaerisporangium krabiense TaxID=763782 RepID=A0A7W9DRZ1_9ACTN|nr:CGNR zinc finger domain-containing protein [Sphaerisporangium krabiense]MBB5628644.1 putative RNA-binding Zn ribbon-like protein [Sphaerisporangium krabiense]
MDAPAELLRDFVNTYDVESDTDELASPAELALWLRERALITEADRAVDDDLAVAVGLREGLRAALRPGAEAAPALARLESALAAFPLRVALPGGVPTPEPVGEGAARGLGLVAAAVLRAHADGSWPRLKVCADATCQWAFLDSSKNRSRSWCSMRVCGNRTKTRAYRARRRQDSPSPAGSR